MRRVAVLEVQLGDVFELVELDVLHEQRLLLGTEDAEVHVSLCEQIQDVVEDERIPSDEDRVGDFLCLLFVFGQTESEPVVLFSVQPSRDVFSLDRPYDASDREGHQSIWTYPFKLVSDPLKTRHE